MNYYRRYVGSYLKKTTKNTMVEDGAYTRMLDTYYADEKPLDPSEVYIIARAMNAPERKAVDSIIAKYFYLGSDGLLHNEKADEELGIAIQKIEKQRINGPINGAKGGRPKKPKPVPENTQGGLSEETKLGSEKEPTRNQPSAVSHQPSSKPPSEKRYHGRETTGDSAATFAAAAMQRLQPPGDEVHIDSENSTPAGMLAAVLLRNEIKATAFHPLVVEWARNGVTVDGLRAGIATARLRKPSPENVPLAYLDTILADKSKPVDNSWKRDDSKAAALCTELGIPGPKIGEQSPQFHARIEQALAQRARSQVA